MAAAMAAARAEEYRRSPTPPSGDHGTAWPGGGGCCAGCARSCAAIERRDFFPPPERDAGPPGGAGAGRAGASAGDREPV